MERFTLNQHSVLLRFTLILFLTASTTAFPSLGSIFSKNGELTKDKSYDMFYVGETLTLNCKKKSDFIGKIAFTQGTRNISQEYVKKINATHGVMEKVVTDDDFKRANYECLDTGMSASDQLIGAPVAIYTDYAPTNATDRQLVWLDEKTLYITWAFGNVTYKNDHAQTLIRVTAEWCFDPTNENNWQNCYDGKARNASCAVTGITNEWGKVHVRVNITNRKRGDMVSTLFPGIPIRDYVKPSPVQTVTVAALSSKKANLSVTTSLPAALVYNVTYYTEVNGHRKEGWVKTKDKSVEISGLHPHYKYFFEVRSKYEENRGYWSDLPSEIPSLQMPEDGI